MQGCRGVQVDHDPALHLIRDLPDCTVKTAFACDTPHDRSTNRSTSLLCFPTCIFQHDTAAQPHAQHGGLPGPCSNHSVRLPSCRTSDLICMAVEATDQAPKVHIAAPQLLVERLLRVRPPLERAGHLLIMMPIWRATATIITQGVSK